MSQLNLAALEAKADEFGYEEAEDTKEPPKSEETPEGQGRM